MPRDSLTASVRRRARRLFVPDSGIGGRPVVPDALLELARTGPAPLARRRHAASKRLRVAVIIPSFRRGSGGHNTIVNLTKALVRRGHLVSLWLEDFEHLHARDPAALTRRRFEEFFGSGDLELHGDFAAWRGADIALATGWQTVARALLLPDTGARAYLVQDHEPEFYGTSAQALLAAETYRQGLHCIAASAWLADLLRTRYGASASHFDLAVDHAIYHSTARVRRNDLVIFYARAATPRRGVPLGLLALHELASRRPEVKIALFGEGARPYAPFPHKHLGVLSPRDLADLYTTATLGMVFSLTNPSLIGLEMMACGLPAIELSTRPMMAEFSNPAPLALAPPAPLQICSTIEALLDDGARRARLGGGGISFIQSRTWDQAAEQVEGGLRRALNETC